LIHAAVATRVKLPLGERGRALKQVIITADDFGLAPQVNEAVETAHRDGILSAASLMVAAPAAADAIARARRMPRLRVGLHLVLVDGHPCLPPAEIPDLVDPNGRLRSDLARFGLNIFSRPRVRAQLEAEIEAQFDAFRASGLALDHANAHKHFHLHPTVAGAIIAVGRAYGLRALRVPREPSRIWARAEPGTRPGLLHLTGPFARHLARRAHRAGLHCPDAVLGLAWSGAMTASRLAGLLAHLPEGCTEIYLHPATSDAFAGHADGYGYVQELAALVAPDDRGGEARRSDAWRLCGFRRGRRGAPVMTAGSRRRGTRRSRR
jgi:hopanoid biosynthesis associated protein HpnK